MSEINDRLSMLIDALTLSQREFANRVGTTGSRISNITTGRNKPDSELLKAIIEEFRNVNITWLLTGEGDIFFENGRNVNLNVNPNVNLKAKKQYKNNTKIDMVNDQSVPYYADVNVFAGKGSIESQQLQENITDYIYVPTLHGAQAYVNVHGHSMYPKYCSGDIIAIKRVYNFNEVQYGQVYVVITNENRVVKYLRKGDNKSTWKLLSDNPKFDDSEVEIKNVLSLWLVLGKITKDVM